MNTSPTLPVPQSQEQITFDVSPPFFKDGCSLNPSTYNPSADQVNYWQENSGNIMELYGNGFPTTCNPSPLEDIYYSLSGFITLINGNSVLIKPGGFLHQVTGDSSVTWNLDMKFESSSGTVYTFTNLKGIVGSNGLMNITSGTTSNGYGVFKQPTNEGTVQFTNLEDDAGNVFTTYDDAIKLANYDPTTGTSTPYTICSQIPTINLNGSYSSQNFNGNVTINGESTFYNCNFSEGNVTITANSNSCTFDRCTFTENVNVTINANSKINICNFYGNVTITANSNIINCNFYGNVIINKNVKEVTLKKTTNILGTLTIGEGSNLTNSGNLTCNVLITGTTTTTYNLPPLIRVFGTLTNEKKSKINTSNMYLDTNSGSSKLGDGIILEKGSKSTNSGTISGSTDKVKTLLTLETDSSLTNNGTINGNYIQDTGSSLTNNGTINESSNNQS